MSDRRKIPKEFYRFDRFGNASRGLLPLDAS